MAIDACCENFSGAVLKALAASTTKFYRVPNHGHRYRLEFRMRYA
jgi:hypothetical protein